MNGSEQVTIAVPTEVATAMRRAVELGEYESLDAIVDHALRHFLDPRRKHEAGTARLRAAIEQSDAGGDGVPADQVYAHLRARLTRRQAA